MTTRRGSNQPTKVPRKSRWTPSHMTDTTEEWLGRLEHADPAERAEAVFVLGGSVDNRSAVIVALRLRLADVDSEVVESAAASLAQLGDQPSLDAILQSMPTGKPRDRRNAAWGTAVLALSADTAARERATAALIAFHRRARGSSRKHAALLLADLGVQASSAHRKPITRTSTDDSRDE